MSLKSYLWGPASPLGLAIAAFVLIADQLHKWWMLNVYDIGAKGTVAVTPFLDLVLVYNRGISYGLFQQQSWLGQALLIAFALGASIVLAIWMARTRSPLAAASQGLIMGGALANAIDRVIHGGVVDFFSLHAYGYYWYIFNIADIAIIAGVVGLLYDSLLGGHKKVGKEP